MMKRAEKFRFKVDDAKVSIGHRSHMTGTGAHDNRPRKQRTRSGQRKAWKKEYGV